MSPRCTYNQLIIILYKHNKVCANWSPKHYLQGLCTEIKSQSIANLGVPLNHGLVTCKSYYGQIKTNARNLVKEELNIDVKIGGHV